MNDSHASDNMPVSGSPDEMRSALFAQLVMQQSSMAMMLLGKTAHPETGKMVRDLPLPENCTLAAIIRKDAVLAVRGETVLQAGDEVLAVVASHQQAALETLLGPANDAVAPPIPSRH